MFSSPLLNRVAAAEAVCHQRFGAAQHVEHFGPITAIAVGAPQGDPVATDTGWLGGKELPSATEFDAFERFSAAHFQTATINMLSHQGSAALPLLKERGYQLDYLLHLYIHDLKSIFHFDASTLREESNTERWTQLAAQGFGPGTEHMMRQVAHSKGTRLFIAQIDGEDAASGAFALHDGIAAFHGMATRPEFRGRGAQSSLLSYRLHRAAQVGADLATVFVTPGTASERNVERAKFQLAGMRLTFTQRRK